MGKKTDGQSSQTAIIPVSKISTAKIIGNVKKQFPVCEDGRDRSGEKVCLMRVVGVAQNIARGVSAYGEWVRFDGNFMATKIIDGTVYQSRSIFLPELATLLVEGAMVDTEGVISECQLAFDIYAVWQNNSVGYEYEVIPLFKATMPECLAQINAGLPALPAPIAG